MTGRQEFLRNFFGQNGPNETPKFKPIEIGEKARKRKKSPSPESRPKKKGKPKRSKDEDVDLTKGMENPDPKPNIELVEIPNIPLANQPSANIPPSTNRNLRNVQLTDLDMNDEGELFYKYKYFARHFSKIV